MCARVMGSSSHTYVRCEFIKISHAVCDGFESAALTSKNFFDDVGYEHETRRVMLGTSMRLAESCEFIKFHTKCVVSASATRVSILKLVSILMGSS